MRTLPTSTTERATLFHYLKAVRSRQWTKNLIVFAAPLFAFSLTLQSLLGALLAFTLFCATSSSFYLVNDVMDVEADRQHPVKRNRPIASGMISIPTALSLAVGLMLSAVLISWRWTPGLGCAITGYALVQVAYNLRLKHTVMLDIMAIATGFVLRAFGGAAATQVTLSPWFLLCTALLALFLAIEKRKAELRRVELKGGTTRKVLQRYSLALLSRMEHTVTTGTVMSYALWSFGPQVSGASTPWMLITLPCVMYGIFRYQLLSDPQEIHRYTDHHGSGGNTEQPEEMLLSDKPLLLAITIWLLEILIILLLNHLGII